jgi:hypothetical protein
MNESLYNWLLEPDPANPGVRSVALRDLLHLPADDPQRVAARREVMQTGPVPAILAAQDAAGWWEQPGPGYSPKYTGTVWSVIQLALLGADGADGRVRAATEHLLAHSRSPYGGFSAGADPAGMIHCLQGNLVAALLDLDCAADPRLQQAIDWLARSVTGEGIAPAEQKQAVPRYYRSGNCAPGFACAANDGQPCAWGAARALLALSKLPPNRRTATIQGAIDAGVDFLLSVDLTTAAYPIPSYSNKPSRSWFQLQALPQGYVTDLLLVLEVLVALGYRHDPRLAPALAWLQGKADADGRWRQEYTYNGKTWVDIEQKGQPSKWVTLRALKATADR